MANLTQDQAAILVWIVESGDDTVVLAEVFGGATLIAGSLNLDVKPGDVRELDAQDLIRFAGGDSYDLTNAGRMVYSQLKSPPPPERPSPGFHPTT